MKFKHWISLAYIAAVMFLIIYDSLMPDPRALLASALFTSFGMAFIAILTAVAVQDKIFK